MNDNNEIRSFRDLLVWQKGIELTKDIYALTQRFPADEKFGLVSQLRRAEESQVEPLIAQVHELQKMLHSLRAKLTTRH